MTLATKTDLARTLGHIADNTGYILSAGQVTEDRLQFIYAADGHTCIYAMGNNSPILPLELETSREVHVKYQTNTGKSWEDNCIDFLYHWATKWVHFFDLDQIKAQMQDPATAGALSTMFAVNRYLRSHPEMSDAEIKKIFIGSRWQWAKMDNGDWMQKTLYPYSTTSGRPEIVIDNLSWFSYRSVSSLKTFSTFLEVQNYNRTELVEPDEEEEDAQDTLLGHSDRATTSLPFKQGKEAHRTFLGVELELEGHSRSEFKSLNTIKEHAIFKRDGSLNNGVEICSAPATLGVHKEEFKKFFDALTENGSNLEAQSSCGMHVHIDRKKLSTLHVANLCLFLNNPDNETPIVKIAGRYSNSYCERINHKYNDFTINTGGSSRYRRVNLTNSATVELRLFASTTNYKDFCARLEFTQASVDYTRPGETNIPCKAIPMWSNFKDYVLSHKKFYPNLIAVMGQ